MRPLALLSLNRSSSLVVIGIVPLALTAQTNIAPDGTGFMGHSSSPTVTGTYYTQSSNPSQLTDGIVSTTSFSTTFQNNNYAAANIYDFVGVSWTTPQDNINEVVINVRTFFDGGWFASSANSDNATAPDDSVDFAPIVQYSTDGSTWTNVAGLSDTYDASDYSGSTSVGPAETFSFNTISGITAIRVIGDGYGRNISGPDKNGFLGISEIQVFAIPEPSAFALLAGGCTLLSVLLRRRR